MDRRKSPERELTRAIAAVCTCEGARHLERRELSSDGERQYPAHSSSDYSKIDNLGSFSELAEPRTGGSKNGPLWIFRYVEPFAHKQNCMYGVGTCPLTTPRYLYAHILCFEGPVERFCRIIMYYSIPRLKGH